MRRSWWSAGLVAVVVSGLVACGGPELVVKTHGAPAKVYFQPLTDASGQPLDAAAQPTLLGQTEGGDEDEPYVLEWRIPKELRGARAALQLAFPTGLKELQISLRPRRDTLVTETPPVRMR
ncbi:MAG: hypothetical protein D6776_09895 [Planctomycetota bacterium]|nr:MAG: hypothetical protein D6776_09895 [Planctomycetota bacterium]